jgi:D-alanine transaminase
LSRIVYVNGELVPESEARISIFDRGFIFGDGVYEVIPVIRGKLVDRQYFLERLTRSLNELAMAWPCSETEYLQVLEQLVAQNKLAEGVVYSQVTRGVADRDFAFPANTPTSFIGFTSAMPLLDNPAAQTGIAIVTTPDLRWKRRDIKSINLLAQCLAKQDAISRGAKEGWMVEDDVVTEGVTSSAYIVKDGTVITRPLSNSILPGIRRRTLLEIAAEAGIATEQRAFSVAEAIAADEAFISSATTIAVGVISIDGAQIGNGTPGPITMQLRDLYKARLLQEVTAQEVTAQEMAAQEVAK